jgi:hypothetical protein
MTPTEARAQDKLRVRVEAWRRQKLRDRVTLAQLERSSWLVCALKGCEGATEWVVDLAGVQRAVCACHGAEAFSHGRAILAVEAFLPADPC